MASDLTVQTIRGPGSGSNANQILIPTGQKIVAQNGGLVSPGHIIQVTSNQTQTAIATTSTSRTNSGFSASITPLQSTSKILVLFHTYGSYCPSNTQMLAYLYRNGSNVVPNDKSWFENEVGGVGIAPTLSAMFMDSPASTSTQTYSIYYRSSNGNSVYLMNNGPDYGIMTMTLMEIAQ